MKKHNFDQLKFDQVIVSRRNSIKLKKYGYFFGVKNIYLTRYRLFHILSIIIIIIFFQLESFVFFRAMENSLPSFMNYIENKRFYSNLSQLSLTNCRLLKFWRKGLKAEVALISAAASKPEVAIRPERRLQRQRRSTEMK